MTIKNQLEERILEMCLAHDSLLTLLRDNEFDEDKFHALKTILDQYRSELKDDKLIRRDIAGCLRIVETTLDSASIYQSTLQLNDHRRKKRLQDAHYEIWEILNDILDINLK